MSEIRAIGALTTEEIQAFIAQQATTIVQQEMMLRSAQARMAELEAALAAKDVRPAG